MPSLLVVFEPTSLLNSVVAAPAGNVEFEIFATKFLTSNALLRFADAPKRYSARALDRDACWRPLIDDDSFGSMLIDEF